MSDRQIVSIEMRENGLLATALPKEIDFDASEALKEAVEEANTESPSKLWVIDLSAVLFLPSVGIGMLVHLLNASKAKGAEFRLVGVNPKIREMFRLSAIEQLFDFRDDLAAAFE